MHSRTHIVFKSNPELCIILFVTAGDYVVRALSILGLIFIVLALVAGSLIMFIDKKVVTLIAGGVAITAGKHQIFSAWMYVHYACTFVCIQAVNTIEIQHYI